MTIAFAIVSSINPIGLTGLVRKAHDIPQRRDSKPDSLARIESDSKRVGGIMQVSGELESML
jgi:hypothetical protein